MNFKDKHFRVDQEETGKTRQKYFLTSLSHNPVPFTGGTLLASVPFKIKQAISDAKLSCQPALGRILI